MIETVSLNNFTAFTRLDVSFSPKINVIIGENGTGKTHLLKAVYALCSMNSLLKNNRDISEEDIAEGITERLLQTFMPLDGRLGSMHHRGKTGNARIGGDFIQDKRAAFSFHNNSKSASVQENRGYETYSFEPVFIPAKEVLAQMEGFVSLYNKYRLSFDVTYYDICSLLDLPQAREDRWTENAKQAMNEIEKVVEGRFIFHGGGRVTFKTTESEYSANSVAEGFRKAGMLSRLLETGVIQPGVSGPLLWDEPEANLNPKLMRLLVEILLGLSREGQQMILATHDYVLLKWFDLLMEEGDEVRFHTLRRDDDSGEVKIESTDDFLQIGLNSISDTFAEIYDEDVKRALGGSVNG